MNWISTKQALPELKHSNPYSNIKDFKYSDDVLVFIDDDYYKFMTYGSDNKWRDDDCCSYDLSYAPCWAIITPPTKEDL